MDIMDIKIISNKNNYLIVEPVTIKKDALVSEAMQILMDNPYTRKIYVVGADKKLLGSISYFHIIRASSARFKIRKDGAISFIRYIRDMFMDDVGSLMEKATYIRENQTPRDAIKIMLDTGQTDIPVVDDNLKLVGEVRGMEIMRISLDAVKHGEERRAERLNKTRKEKGIGVIKVDPVTLEKISE